MLKVHELYESLLNEDRNDLPYGTPGSVFRRRRKAEVLISLQALRVLLGVVFTLVLGIAIGRALPAERIEMNPPSVEPATHEIEVIKKVLSGVVETMTALAQNQAAQPVPSSSSPSTTGEIPNTTSSSESFPYPVTISSEKANLRGAPTWTAPTLVTLTKGAVVLAQGIEGGWVKVSTPKGVSAWVARDLLELGGGQNND